MDSDPRRTAATVAFPCSHQKCLVLVLAESPFGWGAFESRIKDPVVFFASMCLVGENLLACTAWLSSRFVSGNHANFILAFYLWSRWATKRRSPFPCRGSLLTMHTGSLRDSPTLSLRPSARWSWMPFLPLSVSLLFLGLRKGVGELNTGIFVGVSFLELELLSWLLSSCSCSCSSSDSCSIEVIAGPPSAPVFLDLWHCL